MFLLVACVGSTTIWHNATFNLHWLFTQLLSVSPTCIAGGNKMASQEDEYTFLCGFQKIRRYGSTCDLNSPPNGFRKYSQIILHEVQPNDTLQSLELKYNSSMFEIKRINRLWSNDSLHCKTHITIPLFNETRSAVVTPTQFIDSKHDRIGSPNSTNKTKVLDPLSEQETDESANDFFKRIDSNVKQTKRAVKKLNKKT